MKERETKERKAEGGQDKIHARVAAAHGRGSECGHMIPGSQSEEGA